MLDATSSPPPGELEGAWTLNLYIDAYNKELTCLSGRQGNTQRD